MALNVGLQSKIMRSWKDHKKLQEKAVCLINFEINAWIVSQPFKGTVMQIEKALIRIAYGFQKHPENFSFQLFIILQNLPVKFAIFLKSSLLFKFLLSVLFTNKILRLNHLKIRTARNAKILVFGYLCSSDHIFVII